MAAQARRGTCRIIGGRWRGRKIRFHDAEGLRPTTDRIRETVFNWLQPYISRSRCLDCFAGSGILGFEALSRGAAEVVYIEQNNKTVKCIKDNISLLDTDKAVIHHADTLAWTGSVQIDSHFDLVFLDPPFNSDLLPKTCSLLLSSGCLAEDAIIYVEHAAGVEVGVPDSWVCLKQKTSGQVSYKLFENKISGSS